MSRHGNIVYEIVYIRIPVLMSLHVNSVSLKSSTCVCVDCEAGEGQPTHTHTMTLFVKFYIIEYFIFELYQF